jgi:UDPglucose 6-dehydrogenase|tara:strand:- start:196 stop:1497 length:1302 start_codon:yes stop_codon:yes gene_type:complete
MNISVIGVGYVGLVTGACFAEFGLNVTCCDKDKLKVDSLNKGKIPIYEPGLEELVKKNTKEGRLHFTTDLSECVKGALVIFIAVGTPPKDDGSADLTFIEEVAKTIAENMDGYKVIVTKSTVPVGTGKIISEIIGQSQGEKGCFDVVSNPEFLREGSALEDFMRPNRVVLGANSPQAIAILKDLYKPLFLIDAPFVITNVETAEMIKYASNAFLATKISFINEMANLCEKVGADVHVVAKGMGLDHRIGPKFLHPGPGFGGSCFPKDTLALVQVSKENNFRFELVEATLKVNERQKVLMLEKIKKAIGDLKNKKIAVWGLTFKPNTDDMRDAPSLDIIKGLLAKGASIKTFDPAGIEEAKKFLKNSVEYSNDMYKVLADCDALIIFTEWNQFRNPDFEKLKESLKTPLMIDLRNIYDPEKINKLGFQYICVGR